MTINRRIFLTTALCGLSLAALADSENDDASKVRETDPTALEFGYKQDTAQVDEKRYPNHTSEQKCAGCAMYQSRSGAPWAGCMLFAPKQVSANGWCNQWFKRME